MNAKDDLEVAEQIKASVKNVKDLANKGMEHSINMFKPHLTDEQFPKWKDLMNRLSYALAHDKVEQVESIKKDLARLVEADKEKI